MKLLVSVVLFLLPLLSIGQHPSNDIIGIEASAFVQLVSIPSSRQVLTSLQHTHNLISLLMQADNVVVAVVKEETARLEVASTVSDQSQSD
jgi:hypothetical protein